MRLILLAALVLAATGAGAEGPLERSIQAKLGRPYVWGAEGLKSYDCSGFVWRAFRDAGVLTKRTTARKLFFSLPVASEQDRFTPGALVFFKSAAHVGIMRNQKEFFHASSSHGTIRAPLNSYWRSQVCGYRIFRVGGP